MKRTSATLTFVLLLTLSNQYSATAIAEHDDRSSSGQALHLRKNSPNQPSLSRGEAIGSTMPRSELMKKVYKNFLILQSYLHEPNKFKSEANAKAISSLLSALNNTFHSSADFPVKMAKKPGFAARLTLLREMLADSEKRFAEGKKDWVLWRLTAMSNHCISCHAAHNVSITFDSNTFSGLPSDHYRRGDFLLATRQYEKSAKEFMKAALKKNNSIERSAFDALRKWLFINVRINQNPRETLHTLRKIRPELTLTRHQAGELSEWFESLSRWEKESTHGTERSSLAEAERLLRQGLNGSDPVATEIGQVEVLRSLAILHSLLEQDDTSAADRRKALYYLGLSYSKIPMFFMYELPELYLEECIRSYPKTEEAQLSYKLFRQLQLQSFTGSSGAHIPKEEQDKSSLLHDFAYGS
jgi:hypothetical protein